MPRYRYPYDGYAHAMDCDMDDDCSCPQTFEERHVRCSQNEHGVVVKHDAACRFPEEYLNGSRFELAKRA